MGERGAGWFKGHCLQVYPCLLCLLCVSTGPWLLYQTGDSGLESLSLRSTAHYLKSLPAFPNVCPMFVPAPAQKTLTRSPRSLCRSDLTPPSLPPTPVPTLLSPPPPSLTARPFVVICYHTFRFKNIFHVVIVKSLPSTLFLCVCKEETKKLRSTNLTRNRNVVCCLFVF